MSFPRYPKYKDSGVEWLGEVPEHWTPMPIRLAAKLESGHTPSRSKPEYWENCTTPWFTLGDVWQIREEQRDIVTETEEKVSNLGLANSAARLLPAGTVMLSRTASVGFAAIMGVPMATTQDFANWVCGPSLLPKFLLNVFHAMKGEFIRLRYGSTHNTIYMPDIASFRFAMPPMQEQAELVAFLDIEAGRVRALQLEQQRLMELLTQQVNALVLSGFSAPGTKELRLGMAASVISRPVAQKAGESYTRLGLFNRGRGLFHKDPSDMEDMGESDFFWIEEGDLVISGQFAWEGAVAIARKMDSGCVVSHRYHVLRGKEGVALTEYLLGLLCTRHWDFLLNENARGAAGRNRPLNISSLLKEKIPVPSMRVQEAIARAIRLKAPLFDELTKQSDLLEERRSALISAAVTGKIDVRGLAAQEAA